MSRKDVIRELDGRMKDPDLARLFENTFPNTLGEFFVIRDYSGSKYIQIPPSSTLTK